MNTIRILPEKVAAQIAAGEVIDRPSSVLRELLDNSIDAGADRIVINMEKGGKGLIKVSDNGCGMSRDDLLLCVESHATSKITTTSDLYCVKSLGFRGEALPSIGSVSRLQITSRPKDQLAGQKLVMAGGKMIRIDETGAPPGTIVEVRDLFFNIPARRKFLRAVRTEANHIIDTFSRAVLPFPGTSFMLTDSGKTLMSLPASDHQLSRLSALLGRRVAEAMIKTEQENDELTITAFLAPPEFSRSRGDRLFVYVNGRNIRDRVMTRAVMDGYGQRLMKGQYPQAVIFLEIDPSMVDVNVHPSKQEVRFHNNRQVFDTIVSTVEKALAPALDFLGDTSPAHDIWGSDHPRPESAVSESMWTYSRPARIEPIPAMEEQGEQASPSEELRIIGQLGNTYIMCQVKDGLLMVDQHAAHERIMYENLKKGFNASRVEVQALLIPHKLELSIKEKRIVLEKGDQLSRFGIELDHFGGNTFLLRSVPAILKDMEWESFISELPG